MRIPTLLLSLPLLLAGQQWRYEIISGAGEGTISSKEISGVQRTYIAYRDVAGGLAVRKIVGGTTTNLVVWTAIQPENIHVNVNPHGKALITFWSGFRFRYAEELSNASGNCGPGSTWRCDMIALPNNTGAQGVKRERVVGAVDAFGNLHFIYLLLKAGLAPAPSAPNASYYVARSAGGVWQPALRQEAGDVFASPTQMESNAFGGSHWVGLRLTHEVAIAAASGGAFPTLAYQAKLLLGGVGAPADFVAWYADIDNVSLPKGYCVMSSYTGSDMQAWRTIAFISGDGWLDPMSGYFPVAKIAGSVNAPTDFCNVAYSPTNVPSIAYTKANQTVNLVTAPNNSNFSGPWTETLVDNTAQFRRPYLTRGPGGKFWILYQGPGYLKLAQQL